MRKQPRPLSRSEALEILAGLALMLGAIAWWQPAAAAFTAGAVLLGGSLYFRRPI